MATRGAFFGKKNFGQIFFPQNPFQATSGEKIKICKKNKFCKKNLRILMFLRIGHYFYVHVYNTKVICMSALKLYRRENKSIKMIPTDFRPNRKFKMVARGAFFGNKFFFSKSILGHFGLKKTNLLQKNNFSQRTQKIFRNLIFCVLDIIFTFMTITQKLFAGPCGDRVIKFISYHASVIYEPLTKLGSKIITNNNQIFVKI